jgi:aromatic-L-amino-acid decarboxylase
MKSTPDVAPATAPHMTPDQFREVGRRMVDRIADYMERVGDFPVRSRVRPGDVASLLPEHAPERAESWDDILGDLDRVVMPGITHWQSPRFFGYFPCNTSGPAILADMLSDALNAQGMMWSTSPAVTEVETRMLDWMGRALGLPESFLSTSGRGAGVIQGTASESSLVCLLAARDRALRSGRATSIEKMAVYTSTQAHSSIAKDARIAGISDAHVRLIPTDATYAMDASALARAMRDDASNGLVPIYICATVGTTSSGAIDPVRAIVDAARDHHAWVHVDAAYAGAAAICPEHRAPLMDGVEGADSYVFNPHKWLLTTFDCSTLWVRDRKALIDALSITPEYLRNAASDSGAVIDYRDWQIPLGRRFRALKLWFVMRHYGVEGLRAYIREHIRLAHLVESLIDADDRFERPAARCLSLVTFRLKGENARTQTLMERVNASGEAFFSHTILPRAPGSPGAPSAPSDGLYTIRMAIGATTVAEHDVRRAWDAIRREAARV